MWDRRIGVYFLSNQFEDLAIYPTDRPRLSRLLGQTEHYVSLPWYLSFPNFWECSYSKLCREVWILRKAQMAMLEGNATTNCNGGLSFVFQAFRLSIRLLTSTCLAMTNAWVKAFFYAWASFIVCGYKACRAFIIGQVIFSYQLISESFPLHTHKLRCYTFEDIQHTS